MVGIEVFLGFVVDVNLELGYFVLCFGDYYEIIRGQDLQLFSFILVLVILSKNDSVGRERSTEM